MARSKDEIAALESASGVLLSVVNSLASLVRKKGGTYEDFYRLVTPEGEGLLEEIAKLVVRKGKSETDHVIDLDSAPFVPEGWKEVEEHKKGGKLKWDSKKIQLYLSESQKGDKYVEGNKLRKELENLPTLNAKVLDFLLAHKELIPEEWKRDEKGNTRYVFFWGTIYRHSDGNLYVRCLYWSGGRLVTFGIAAALL